MGGLGVLIVSFRLTFDHIFLTMRIGERWLRCFWHSIRIEFGFMAWKYEPNPDRKHKRNWNEPVAGFVQVGSDTIGKCPSNLGVSEAENLLNTGLAYPLTEDEASVPQRIYNVCRGVLYRATPTVEGVSYHGFPEHPKQAQKLPKSFKSKIVELAVRLGCEQEIKACLNVR